jgi:glycine hydroxymethyltransferase
MINDHNMYRREAINLIASENTTSPLVRWILASDLGHRYSADFYGGTKFIRKIIAKTESYIRELFDVNHAIVSALSGNVCVLALALGMTKAKNKIMVVEKGESGGYPFDYSFINRQKITFSFSTDNMNIIVDETIEAIKKLKPKLVVFGSSFFPFPHPVKEITDIFSKRKTLHFAYDGSHVLGLIAGKQFQDPIREGASVLIGSTHKTFPGPQGGIIVTDEMDKYELLSSAVDLDIEKGIRLVDNNHPNRVAALGMAALEMLEFGETYAKQVVKNSKALAQSLDRNGVPVKFKNKGFTESHQVLLDDKSINVQDLKTQAEKYGLIIDSGLRLGTSEITKLGMKELEAKALGEIFAQIYHGNESSDLLRRIRDLARMFREPIYCFKDFNDIDF